MRRVDEETEAGQCEQEVDEGEPQAPVAAAPLAVVLAGSAKGGDEAVADCDGDGRQARGAARRGPEVVAQRAGGAVQQVPEELQPAEDEEHLVLPRPPAGVGGRLDADHGREAERGVEGARYGDQGQVESRYFLARLALAPLARPLRRQMGHLLLVLLLLVLLLILLVLVLVLLLGAVVSVLRAPASGRDCVCARARRHVVIRSLQFDIIQAFEGRDRLPGRRNSRAVVAW